MFRIVALLLALTSSASAQTVKWHEVTLDGYQYQMPPLSCMVGPLPPYQLIYVPQEDLDGSLPPDHPPGAHYLGQHSTVNGEAVVYISDSLPWLVSLDVLQHELAHLRGCEHGNIWRVED